MDSLLYPKSIQIRWKENHSHISAKPKLMLSHSSSDLSASGLFTPRYSFVSYIVNHKTLCSGLCFGLNCVYILQRIPCLTLVLLSDRENSAPQPLLPFLPFIEMALLPQSSFLCPEGCAPYFKFWNSIPFSVLVVELCRLPGSFITISYSKHNSLKKFHPLTHSWSIVRVPSK